MTRFLGDLGLSRLVSGSVLLAPHEHRGNICAPSLDYERRGNATQYDRNSWSTLWPSARAMSGDGAGPYNVASDMWQTAYSPWLNGNPGGNPGGKFILGRLKDINGDGVSGAKVQGFRTSDDLYIGECTADAEGYYAFPTPYEGVAHYLIAYRDGSPDISGTTVDTLIPTNIDGT